MNEAFIAGMLATVTAELIVAAARHVNGRWQVTIRRRRPRPQRFQRSR